MGLRNDREDNYVYVYLDPRKPGDWSYEWEGEERIFDFQPFYIGRGIDGRMQSHMEPSKRKYKTLKNHVINKIEASGLTPIYYKIFEDLDFDHSEVIEIDFIEKFGRRDLKQGPLTNRTFGGSDVAFKREYVKLDPSVRRYSTKSRRVDQFDLDGNFIRKWESIADINKDLGYVSTRIGACCNGRTGHTYGFIWKYDGTCPAPEKIPKKSYKRKECFLYKDGKFIAKYDSQKDLASAIGTTKGNVTSVTSGIRKTILGYQIFNEYQGEECKISISYENRPVYVQKFDKDMNLIETFESVKKAMEITGISRNNFNRAFSFGIIIGDFYFKLIGRD